MATYSLTVQNKNGAYDGDMVVRQYSSLTINSGNVLTTDQPCRGLLIYVQGNCVINGTLSMTARGPAANPTVAGASDVGVVDSAGLRFPFRTATGSNTLAAASSLLSGCGNAARALIAQHASLAGNGTVVGVDRQGANGGNAVSGSNTTGNDGSSGVNKTGGGGSGGAHDGGASGAGSYGSCWGGGSGGGGTRASSADPAQPWGGAGGFGRDTGGYGRASGGAGNPGGGHTVTSNGDGNGTNGGNGTGGLIVLIVGGNLTIGSGGLIEADGVAGGPSPSGLGSQEGHGGSSGGGRIIIAHRGTYTNNGTVRANGGPRIEWSNGRNGRGGNGDIDVVQIL